jgi:hypothetical protein
MLDFPADPEQVRVVACQPEDPPIGRAGSLDEEVPVRDAARQWAERQLTSGNVRNPLQRSDELVVEGTAQDIVGEGVRVGLLLDREAARPALERAARCLRVQPITASAVARSASTSASRPRTATA